MTITATNTSAQGQQREFIARHLDDAASPAAILLYPGFKPTRVRVTNLNDRLTYEWIWGMTKGDYSYTIATGVRTTLTDDVLVVETTDGARPSITLVAAAVLQNKQYQIEAYAG
jgi:hypothetical protein